MLHELRTLARGVGVREAERLLAGRFGGVFSTEVGTMGEIVVLRPYEPEAAARPGAGRGEGEGRLAGGIQGSQTVELLTPAQFMRPLEAQELGKVWELSWLDFASGDVNEAMSAFGAAMPAREKHYPVVGCWSVEVGFALDRIYLLAPFKDWDHRHAVNNAVKDEASWPPKLPVAAVGGGSKLILPAAISGLK
jgi:hypothetical protein